MYQDLIAAHSLLSMVLDHDGPVAVALENKQGGSFDDVVEYYPGYTIWKQAKWAANPLRDLLTIDELSAIPRRRKRSLIASFAQSWRSLGSRDGAFEVHLVSNRYPDEELQGFLEGEPARLQTRLGVKQKKRLRDAWFAESGLTDCEFWPFAKSLRFDIAGGGLEERRREVRRVLKALGSPRDSFDNLIRAIYRWSTDPLSTQLAAPDVEAVLGLTGTAPDNRFRVDHATLVTRESVHRTIVALVQKSRAKYVILLGSPGAGKSTALNTITPLSDFGEKHALIIYNCFTGSGDTYGRTRATAGNFVRFLVREMHRLAPGRWTRRYAEATDLEAVVNEAAETVPGGGRLVIIVDGIDHAAANRTTAQASLFDALPVQLPANATIVVSAQAKEQLPEHLQRLPDRQYLTLPALTYAQTRSLLHKAGVFRACSASNDHSQKLMVSAVYGKAKGHPLVTRYVANWLIQGPVKPPSVARIIARLPAYGQDVREWYQMLPAARSAYARALLAELAACTYPLSAAEADSLVASPKNQYAAEDVLRALSFLLRKQGDVWLFRHDSLRAHANAQGVPATSTPSRHFDLLLKLPNDPRVGEYALELATLAGRQDWAFATVDGDWIAAKLTAGSRLDMMLDGLRALLADAVSRRHWVHSAKWALYLQRLSYELATAVDWREVEKAWLSCRRPDLVMHSMMEGELLLVSASHALGVAGDLRLHGHATEGDELEQIAASTPLDVGDALLGRDYRHRVLPYMRHLALVLSVDECEREAERLARILARDHGLPESKSRRTFKAELCDAAAFACLFKRQWTQVSLWCASTRRCLSARARRLLQGAVALMTRHKNVPRAAVLRALRNDPPLWLIDLAAQREDFREAAGTALQKREKPAAFFDGYSAPLESDEVTRAVQDVFDDVRLSVELGLQSRVETLRAAVMAPPLAKGPLLYSIAVRMAGALPRGRTRSDWRAAGSELVSCLRESGLASLPSPYRWDSYGLGDALVFFLRRMAASLQQDHEKEDLATWTVQTLLPALSDAGLNRSHVVWALLLDGYLPLASNQNRGALLDRLEGETDAEISDKCLSYLRLATAAGQLDDPDRGTRLLTKALRAAITYGYRKDTTIFAFIDGFALLSGVLGDRLREHVVLAASVLEVLRDLTDHDELDSCASDLVCAVALADTKLAARLGKHLRCSLRGDFFRDEPSWWLRARVIPQNEVRAAFEAAGLPWCDAPTGDDANSRRLSGAQPSGNLDELLREYATMKEAHADGWEEQWRIERLILDQVCDRDTFRKVELVVAPESRGSAWPRACRLADAAARAGLKQEATTCINNVAVDALTNDTWYWTSERLDLLNLMVELEPDRARQTMESAADTTVVDKPDHMGFSFVQGLVAVLWGCHRATEAEQVLGVFGDHLRDLMKPYPDCSARWRALLAE